MPDARARLYIFASYPSCLAKKDCKKVSIWINLHSDTINTLAVPECSLCGTLSGYHLLPLVTVASVPVLQCIDGGRQSGARNALRDTALRGRKVRF
jgi:hypothetical protein